MQQFPSMATPLRAKGFVLVLVVDEQQADREVGSIARVCRDYDVSSVDELATEVEIAATQAGNQLVLRKAALDVIFRARERADMNGGS
jgi:hypothetical protein